jgi:hypothetical protein
VSSSAVLISPTTERANPTVAVLGCCSGRALGYTSNTGFKTT